MSRKYVRGNCFECGAAFSIPIQEVRLHQPDEDTILCAKCCKKRFYFDKNRCIVCSEKKLCKGSWLNSLKSKLKTWNGV